MARMLLEDWETQRQFFWHVMPKENVVQIEAATEGFGGIGRGRRGQGKS